ncbi:hypothetical protein SUGI_0481020 [Cryptomeria japonica]|nr:hypothetical protein SUGI_0481020 [Cryptomeria japonica]
MKKLGILNGEFLDLESGVKRRRSSSIISRRGASKINVRWGASSINRREQGAVYPFKDLKNLVMVAGHSVYKGGSKCEKGTEEEEAAWYLESYQRHPGQAATFVDHIREGINMAAMDEAALLLFSGGETRKDAGPRSEAQSYWNVADSHQWFGKQMTVRHRSLTEEHARDSFENLLFSICRFRELTGVYPHNITVVSYDFKQKRFAYLHRSALRFPSFRFFYVGTPASPSSAVAASKGEALVREQFQKDPYGCSGSLLFDVALIVLSPFWMQLRKCNFKVALGHNSSIKLLLLLFSWNVAQHITLHKHLQDVQISKLIQYFEQQYHEFLGGFT